MLLKVLVPLFAATLSLIAVELGLRAFERIPTRQGRLPDYRDTWRKGAIKDGLGTGLGPGGYLQENFDAHVVGGYGTPVRWTNNSQGFRRDHDTSLTPSPNTRRVLSMGDSFTAGYRVGQAETFPYLLEKWLTARDPAHPAEVLIAVTEEPATGLAYLQEHGLRFEPDLVLLGVTIGNDLLQLNISIGLRGPFRLTAPGHDSVIVRNAQGKYDPAALQQLRMPATCLTPRPDPSEFNRNGPQWSAIAESTPPSGLRLWHVIPRATAWRAYNGPQTIVSDSQEYAEPRLFESHALGLFLRDPPQEISDAYDRLFATLAAYQRLADSRQFKFIVVPFPQRFQVQPGDWQATVRIYGLVDSCFDLELPNRRLRQFCSEHHVACFDPLESMRQNYRETRRSLYLPNHDMHWNADGHRALFESINSFLESQLNDTSHRDRKTGAQDRSPHDGSLAAPSGR